MPKICLKLLLTILTISALVNGGFAINQAAEQGNSTSPGLHTIGDDFDALRPMLVGAEHAGYLTNQNLEESLPSARLGQAQFRLSPTALMPQEPKWPAIIVDCPNPADAHTIADQLKLRILYDNNRGLLLTLNTAYLKQP